MGGRRKGMVRNKKNMSNGLAMVNMLIFVIMFTVLSGVMMTVVSSSSRLLEQHVRRAKAYYAAEGAAVYAMDWARRNGGAGNYVIRPVVGPGSMPWSFDPSGNILTPKTAIFSSSEFATGPSSTYQLNGSVNGSVNYQLNW
jgi:hypothetical protein